MQIKRNYTMAPGGDETRANGHPGPWGTYQEPWSVHAVLQDDFVAAGQVRLRRQRAKHRTTSHAAPRVFYTKLELG